MPSQSRLDPSITVWDDPREWWVFNPGPRIDLCVGEGIYDFVMHQRTYQFKNNMSFSPSKGLAMLAPNVPWRCALVDYGEAVVLLYTAETGWDAPAAAWPIWSCHSPVSTLERLLTRYPEAGEPVGTFTGMTEPSTAVEGQERRIFVANLPSFNHDFERVFRSVRDLKKDHPDVKLHFHGSKSLGRMLGVGVDSFDNPVTIRWVDGLPGLWLGNGREFRPEHWIQGKAEAQRRWAQLIGMRLRDVYEARDRQVMSRRAYEFNLRSIKWAFANYDTQWAMRVVVEDDIGDDADTDWVPIDLKYRPRAPYSADKWLCDVCSLEDTCPFSRPGAVCVVDDSPAKPLSEAFKTRRSDDIIDALGGVLKVQMQRAEGALQAETQRNANLTADQEHELDPHLSKLLSDIFAKGVDLAKLVDPQLANPARGRGGRVINATARREVAGADPKALADGFIHALESQGIDINTLTEDEIKAGMAGMAALHTGSLPADGNDDANSAHGSGGSPVASQIPSFRAAPSVDPGVPGA